MDLQILLQKSARLGDAVAGSFKEENDVGRQA